MKRSLRKIEFETFVSNGCKEDHRIGDQVFLMDEYQLGPIIDYEFRAQENIFVEVLSGEGYVIVDGIRYDVKGHSLIAYLKGQQIKVCISGKRAIQRGAAFSDNFLEDLYRSEFRLNDIKTSLLMNPVVSLREEQIFGIKVYINVLKHIATQENNPHNLLCVKFITLALFYGPLYGIFKKRQEQSVFRCPLISSRFFALVEEHFKEKLSLSFYAKSLKISKPYLHQCIIVTTGKTPGYWIDYYRLCYAKKCISSMNMSVLEIAQSLNFSGLPQFCKFFKKNTGLTPTGFRKTLL